MAAIDLAAPTIANFNLAIARRSAVADHEMIGETVAHPADISVIVIEDPGVPLPGAAVVDNDEMPALAQDRRAIDLVANGTSKIGVVAPEKVEGQERKAARLLVTRFLNE